MFDIIVQIKKKDVKNKIKFKKNIINKQQTIKNKLKRKNNKYPYFLLFMFFK